MFYTYIYKGYDLVDWFIKNGHSKTRDEAVKLGEVCTRLGPSLSLSTLQGIEITRKS